MINVFEADNHDEQTYLTISSLLPLQCLQWETRQIRILKAGTLEHIIKYILLITQQQIDERKNHQAIEEEHHDVSYTMHVIFCTYRIFCQPFQLFSLFYKMYPSTSPQQFKFVLHYWLNNYPEDFLTHITLDEYNSLFSSCSEISTDLESNSSTSKKHETNQRLIDLLLSSSFMDDALYKKAYSIIKDKSFSNDNIQSNGNYVSASLISSILFNYVIIVFSFHPLSFIIQAQSAPLAKAPSNCILELDPKFIAQQLTAIDLVPLSFILILLKEL
jgi:hypothetical protein